MVNEVLSAERGEALLTTAIPPVPPEAVEWRTTLPRTDTEAALSAKRVPPPAAVQVS
jgi:hypothetical protein